MMDKALIHATDDFVKAGYPRDAEAMLIVELDGTEKEAEELIKSCLLYTSPRPRDATLSRMPSSA